MKKILAGALALLLMFSGIPVGYASNSDFDAVKDKYLDVSTTILNQRKGEDASKFWVTETFIPTQTYFELDNALMTFENQYDIYGTGNVSNADWDSAMAELVTIEERMVLALDSGYNDETDVDFLNDTIERCREALEAIAVSVDGSDIDASEKWLSPEAKAAAQARLDALKAVNDSLSFTGSGPMLTVTQWQNEEKDALEFVEATLSGALDGTAGLATEETFKALYDDAQHKWSRIFVATEASDVFKDHYYVDQVAHNAMQGALEIAHTFLSGNTGDAAANWQGAQAQLERAYAAFKASMTEGAHVIAAFDAQAFDRINQMFEAYKQALDALVVSVDGTDVPKDRQWVTAEKRQELLAIHTQLTEVTALIRQWQLSPSGIFNPVQVTPNTYNSLREAYMNAFVPAVTGAPYGAVGRATEEDFRALYTILTERFSRIIVAEDPEKVFKGHRFVDAATYGEMKTALEAVSQFLNTYAGNPDANWQWALMALETTRSAFEGRINVGTAGIAPSEVKALDAHLTGLEAQRLEIEALAVSADGADVSGDKKWATAAQKQMALSQNAAIYSALKALRDWANDQDTVVYNTLTVTFSEIEVAYYSYLATYDAVVRGAPYGQIQSATPQPVAVTVPAPTAVDKLPLVTLTPSTPVPAPPSAEETLAALPAPATAPISELAEFAPTEPVVSPEAPVSSEPDEQVPSEAPVSGPDEQIPVVAEKDSDGVTVVVGGVSLPTGAVAIKTVGGNRQVDIRLDESTIGSLLQQGAFSERTIEVPVPYAAEVTEVTVSGKAVAEMVEGGYTVALSTPNFRYDVKLDAVPLLMQAEGSEVAVTLAVRTLSAERLAAFKEALRLNGHILVGEPRAVDVTVTRGTGQTRVERFSKYVPRIFTLPKGTQVTTGVVLNADGTYEHVPTTVTTDSGGKQQVRVESLTNSEYALIYSPAADDVAASHPAKSAVDDMMSRHIVTGTGSFDPDEVVTRGAFIEYVVKTLGLYRKDAEAVSAFSDSGVENHQRAVALAKSRGLVKGYVDGTFGYDKALTVQELNIVYNRLLRVLGSDAEAREVVKSMETVTHGEVLALLRGTVLLGQNPI